MAGQKAFPCQAALVSCNGECPARAGFLCKYGCVGCGNCIAVCESGAISWNENGTAQVDEKMCTACGACVKVCRQEVIHIHQGANYIVVKCSNEDKGKAAKEVCRVSCIGCGICEKICTAEAVKVVNFCAVIDEKLCLSCGMCAVNCPRHAIADLRGIF